MRCVYFSCVERYQAQNSEWFIAFVVNLSQSHFGLILKTGDFPEKDVQISKLEWSCSCEFEVALFKRWLFCGFCSSNLQTGNASRLPVLWHIWTTISRQFIWVVITHSNLAASQVTIVIYLYVWDISLSSALLLWVYRSAVRSSYPV